MIFATHTVSPMFPTDRSVEQNRTRFASVMDLGGAYRDDLHAYQSHVWESRHGQSFLST